MNLPKTIFLISIFTGLPSYAMETAPKKITALLFNGSLNELKVFFAQHPELVNKPIPDRRDYHLPLYYCCNRLTSTEDVYSAIQTLIDCGANVNLECPGAKDPKGNLPVMRWARLFNYTISILDLLIKNGANINQSDNDGTVLHHLIYRANDASDVKIYLNAVTRALEYGADPSIKDKLNKTCFDSINVMKDSTSKIITPISERIDITHVKQAKIEQINKVEELLKNAPQIRENYLIKQAQKTPQKNLTKLYEQKNNCADTTIIISGKNIRLHSSIISVRCQALFALLN